MKKKRYHQAALVIVKAATPALHNTAKLPTDDPTDKYVRQDDHGRYAELSKQVLQDLQKTFPEVFKEPTFPVDRTDVGVTFEHDIRLEDPAKPPPKKKLYTLDDEELKALKS